MGRRTGASCKLCRRAKEKLYLKGEKCFSAKCPISRRPYAPGEHGKLPSRMRISEYGLRLRMKQNAKQIYGLLERQFEKYFEQAERGKGVTGSNLLILLERRLDNVVYRLGFGGSRAEARQLVRHGHIMVNGKKVNIPSYRVKAGETISVKEKSRDQIKKVLEANPEKKPTAWLTLDSDEIEGKILRIPQRDEIDTLIEEHLIVEFYSR